MNLKLHFNLTSKLTLMFVLFAALLVIVLRMQAYLSGRSALETATIADLHYTATEKEAALQFWVEEEQRTVTSLARSLALQAEVKTFMTRPAQSQHDHLVRILQAWVGPGRQYLSMLVIEAESGQVIAATDPGEEGKFKKDMTYFIEGRTQPYVQNVYFSPGLQQPAMTAAAPLYAPDGHVWGVLAGQLNLAEMNEIINRRPDLHRTDETFLVNSAHLFITQPRLSRDPVLLRQGVQTEAVERCLAGQSGAIEAEDYRGVPVIAVYRWLAERQLCLIIKIDQAEALAPAQAFGRTIVLIGSLALLVASLLGLALARTITRPVLALQAGVARFGRGELETRLPETSTDELGRLAREFNTMAATLADKETQLRRHADELEQKVQERTATLQASEERLRLAQSAASMGIWDWDVRTNALTWTPELERLYGLAPGTFTGTYQDWRDRVHAHDIAEVETKTQAAISNHHPFNLEFRIRHVSGEVRWVSANGGAIYDEAGAPVRVLGVNVDITERKQGEERLQQSEAHFRLLVDGVKDYAIFMLDPSGHVASWNSGAEHIKGYRADEIVGRHFSCFYPPADLEAGKPELELKMAAAEGRFEDEGWRVRQDGSQFWANVVITALRDEAGTLRGFAKVSCDMTERKQVEQALRNSENKFSTLFNQGSLPVALSRFPTHEFVDVNEAWMQVFGYTKEELIGKTSVEIGVNRNTERRKLAISEIHQHNPVRNLEQTLYAKSGDALTVLTSVNVIEIGGQMYALTSVQDITERKRMEEELRRSNAELEQFAYIASHDLQEPLRAVGSMLQLLQRRYSGQIDARADEFIRHAVEGAGRMQTLITDLLAFSRIATRGQPFKSINCTEILSDVLANLAVAIQESGAVISYDPLPMVIADRTQLTQVFQNLIGNAIKFRNEEAPVIQISVEQKESEWLFAIRDNGIGIESQYIERIFVIFQRLHTRREYPGTGIGLAVCKKIVERHGGRMWVESQPGQGSAFYFTLPNPGLTADP